VRARLFLFLLLLISGWAVGQHSDCSNARPITDSLIRIEKAPVGSGKVIELQQGQKLDSAAFKREAYSVWFRWENPSEQWLSFDIVPDNISDDYDFMLLDGKGPDFCVKAVRLSEVIVLRSVISRNEPEQGSRTGLREGARSEKEKIGKGSSYSAPIQLSAGNYYLVVSSYRKPSAGFNLHWRPVEILPEPDIAGPVNTPVKNRLRLFIRDSIDGELKSADIRAETIKTGQQFVFEKVRNIEIPFFENLRIHVLRPGYMPLMKEYQVPADSLLMQDTLHLIPIDRNLSVDFYQFLFEANSARMLPESEPALKDLLRFLIENPEVKIEIIGHVNGPNQRNTKEFRRLSEERALQIKKYLLAKDIRKQRLSVKGMGNSMMIYPNPSSAAESERNRRVEIKVTDL
jgi:outer membrane protein OmpA-like peptidoglycan-associated protein